ncbi:hypothetical protein [Paenibacillus sp. GCM10027626]|uniref:hypothetical protein n=1 Tax=Paenibacillus sp. GCM10027626 TaxID=3273411 RepID=UPI0036427D93
MFDPTVFDNLKVAFENELYDLDNLEQRIVISGRKDTVELSVMEREFRLHFHLAGQPEISAEISMHMSLKDLAAEILEQPGTEPGCALSIFFYMTVMEEQEQCSRIDKVLKEIWEPSVSIRQTLSHLYGHRQAGWSNAVELSFHRQINEEQMGDIPELARHMLESLEMLKKCFSPD